MIKRCYLISKDTFLLCLNEKWIYGFLILALIFISIANVPFLLKDSDIFERNSPEKNALQIGFFFINIFSVLISLFLSVISLSNLLTHERLLLVLSKPIRRSELLLGIILGLYFIVLLNWFILVSALFLILYLHTKDINLGIFLGLSPSILLSFLCISLVNFFYLIIPNFLSGILSLLILISGFGITLEDIKKIEPLFLRKALRIGSIILPQVNSLLGISFDMLKIFEVKISKFGIILHTIIFITIVNLINIYRFNRRRY